MMDISSFSSESYLKVFVGDLEVDVGLMRKATLPGSGAGIASERVAFHRAEVMWPWPGVTVRCAAEVAGIELESTRELGRFAMAGLSRADGGSAYRVRRADPEYVVRRVALAYLWFAADADFRVLPLRWRLGPAFVGLTPGQGNGLVDGKRALAELREEKENLVTVVQAAYHYGFYDLVWQLCEAMWALHLRLGFHAQWSDTHLLGVVAARHCAKESDDRRAVGRMLVQLAFGYMGIGEFAEAESVLDEAVTADRDCGHRRGEASAVEALGLLHLKKERPDVARAYFEEAWDIWDRVGVDEDGWMDKERAMALLTHHIGRALFDAGKDLLKAYDCLTSALESFRRLPGGGDPYNRGRVCMSLGEFYLQSGDLGRARASVAEAVEAMAKAGAGSQLANAIELRARYHYRAGCLAEAGADLRAAASGYEEHGDEKALVDVRQMLVQWGV